MLSTTISKLPLIQDLDSLERQELDRFIIDSFSLGNELFIKNASSTQPKLTDWMRNNRKILGDNPTVRYQSFFLSNNLEYIVSGSLKDLEFITFQLYSLKNNENISTNVISTRDFKYIHDESFELIVSPKFYLQKNTLQTSSNDYILIIREFYKNDSIKDKVPSNIKIKKIPSGKHKKDFNENISFTKTNDFIQGVIISTFNLYEQLKGNPNSEIENKYKLALFPTKGNYYEGEVIELDDDEVYEITVYNLPQNLNFIWTFYNIFSRTPDYKKYNVYLNNHNVEYTSENSYKMYLSKYKINNLKNNLETGGYSRGILSLRISEENIPDNFDYSIKKIKINQLD
ncbi:hypothetical protein [Cetobacterium sp.]|uniref:hypothetical protein n=1 Tax=Cetobacterium sp. TaxID=2071632 RepID=UPI003F6735AD